MSKDWLGFPNAIYCAPGIYRDTEAESGFPRRYGDWHDSKDGPWLVHNHLSGSDYSGNLTNVSNYQVFQEEFSEGAGIWWDTVSGGHGTFAIVIDTTKAPDEAYDFLCGLEDYPVADDGHHSGLEIEAQNEAWSQDVERDFIRALEKKFDIEFSEDMTGTDKASNLFYTLTERSNTYWENQQGSEMYIDVDRVVKSATLNDLEDWPFPPTVKNEE